MEKRVYVDESGIKADLRREYARAPRGDKAEDTKRGRSFHRVNVVAARIHDKDGVRRIAAECYQESMNGEKFERWMKDTLIPELGAGYTIIMDNASFHRKKALKELCDKSNIGLLFLPAYSPDLNPIEKDWSNMKRDLRDTVPLYGLLETAIYNYWRNPSKVA